MEDISGVKILIRSNRQESVRRWAEMLRPLDSEVWSSSDDVPSGERPDVIVTASAGYRAIVPQITSGEMPSSQEFYAAADTALHAAKRQGRDRTVGN